MYVHNASDWDFESGGNATDIWKILSESHSVECIGSKSEKLKCN